MGGFELLLRKLTPEPYSAGRLAACGSAAQFALMFAALITFAHFSVSDFM